MKSHVLTTVLAVLALGPVAVSAATLDFEDLGTSGVVPSNYGGLDWSSGWQHYSAADHPYVASSGSSRVFNEFGNLGVIRFGGDVELESLWIAGYGNNQFIEGYDDGVKLFESVHMPTGNAQFGLLLSLNWSGVDEIRIQSSGWGFSNYVLDDLSFTPEQETPAVLAVPRQQAVPDAGGSLALLGLGMGAVVAARRVRKSDAALS